MKIILLLLLCFSCSSVEQKDVDAWLGVDVIELETHPVFSTMQLKKQKLSDGRVMFDYIERTHHRNDVQCYDDGFGRRGMRSRTCTGGERVTFECHNQFFVKGKIIQSYRPSGACYTNCSLRPASNPCSK